MRGIVLLLLLVTVTSRQVEARHPHFTVSSRNVPDSTKSHDRDKRQTWSPPVNLTTFHVRSLITIRYVQATVVATFINTAEEQQDTRFSFRLNPGSFISEFVITIDNETYEAEVVEKKAARKVVDDAKGNSAGFAREVGSSSHFAVDLGVPPGSSVTFSLTYEELLRRDKDLYTHNINIAPGQIVEDMRVDVFITEPQGLESVDAFWVPGTDNLQSKIESNFQEGMTTTTISFAVTAAQQKDLDQEGGLNGRFVVKYDVLNRPPGGENLISNGYFVHAISTEELPPAPKTVVFVIDVSGSMIGLKLEQTKTAMISILGELRDIDRYNILTFSTWVEVWQVEPVQVTNETREAGIIFVENLYAFGATNIHDSLMEASTAFYDEQSSFPAIIFMTDGVPSVGETDPDNIVQNVTEALGGNAALYTVGFGEDVDEFLLKRLAAANGGHYRKVADDDNAAVQMEGFFREVSSPLLYNVKVTYEPEAVIPENVTQSEFSSYFRGKEIVIAGQLNDDYEGKVLTGLVTANSADGPIEQDFLQDIKDMSWMPNMVGNVTERLWAYLMARELLVKESFTQSSTERDALRRRALKLALEYQFVTPVTALLFYTKPRYPDHQPGRRVDSATRPAAGSQSRVGGDPHFIIDLPHNNLTICFDAQQANGTIINLINDPILGIYVNGKVVPVYKDLLPSISQDQGSQPCMLDSLGIQLGLYKIMITPDRVLVDFEIVMRWGIPRTILIGDFNITIHNKRNLTIIVGDAIFMWVTLHSNWANHPDHFDFTVTNTDGFSGSVHGILGQFQYKPLRIVNPHQGISANGHTRGVMKIDGDEKFVFKMREKLGVAYDCWWSHADSYIDGVLEQYAVPGYFSHLENLVDLFE